VAWIALSAAGFFVFTSHQQIRTAADGVRAVDLHAREAADALVDLRVAQQAYVASGQGVAFWMPKVASTQNLVTAALTALRQSMMSNSARTAVDEAAAAMSEFSDVDKRARDYIGAGQLLMAGDVIFTEGGQLVTVAARQVEAARLAEHEAFDEEEAGLRREEALAIGAAGAFVGLIALALAVTGGEQGQEWREEEPSSVAGSSKTTVASDTRAPSESDEGIVSHARPIAASEFASGRDARPQAATDWGDPGRRDVAAGPSGALARNAVVLKTAAALATDLGRVRDTDELSRLLARTADLMDASGLVVWAGTVGSATDELRAVQAHGYTPQMLARMPAVPRSGDNAAAAAYRTGELQIVLSHPGGPSGAIVAPILAADGCIGALSAEIKDGGEGSEAVQAVATMVAAHLAGLLAVSPVDAQEQRVVSR
jgi:hypothetical protein